jgi:hypothetical protein
MQASAIAILPSSKQSIKELTFGTYLHKYSLVIGASGADLFDNRTGELLVELSGNVRIKRISPSVSTLSRNAAYVRDKVFDSLCCESALSLDDVIAGLEESLKDWKTMQGQAEPTHTDTSGRDGIQGSPIG